MGIFADLKRWRFWRHFFTAALACGGAQSGLIQTWLIAYPQTATWVQGLGPLLTVVAVSTVGGLIFAWPRPVEQSYSTPNIVIKVVKGDLLKQSNHLVIGTCDTFDTATPNIIARNSLQGQALDQLFNGDVAELDRLISESLAQHTPSSTIKKEGKQNKYGVGTIAVLRHNPRLIFLAAYCEMNERNEAIGTVDGVWKSLASLWDSVSVHANGSSISVPVIGGGQARLSQLLPAQDSIRLIALSYMFASRKRKICDELHIIVRPADYDRLDRMELQSFLSALRPS